MMTSPIDHNPNTEEPHFTDVATDWSQFQPVEITASEQQETPHEAQMRSTAGRLIGGLGRILVAHTRSLSNPQ